MGFLLSLQGAINQGILWGIMALGVYITFRLLNIADLTVDGSFTTGAAVCAVMLVAGLSPVLATVAALLSGCLAGLVTGLLHTKCKIPAILSGILSQIGLYSINLRIMGKANTPLLTTTTLFTWGRNTITTTRASIVVGLVVTIAVIGILYWFFGTEIGNSIRATGNNEQMVRAVGVDTDITKLIGITLSNGLISLSGALVAQSQGSADVKMGIGAIVIGLASIVIGEVIVGRYGNFLKRLVGITVGSIVYRTIIAMVLQLGLSTDDLKLLTAIIVGIALTTPVLVANRQQVANYYKLTQEVDKNNA